MEENKTKKTGANGLILTVLLIAAIIIAFMWVAIYNLNDQKADLEKQLESSKRDADSTRQQLLRMQNKYGITIEDLESDKDDEKDVANKVDSEDENTVSNKAENATNEVSNKTSNETENKVSNEVENVPAQ